jgi:hypothetical protein
MWRQRLLKLALAVFITIIVALLSWGIVISMAYTCVDPSSPYEYCHEPPVFTSLPEHKESPVNEEDKEE